jgi:methionine-rich copper-binding protein CopC
MGESVQTASYRRVIAGGVRVLLGVLFGAIIVAATAAPAAAHTALRSSDPKAGAQLSTPPKQITLSFTEPIRTAFTRVFVQGPGGARFESGPPESTSADVVQLLRPLGAAGAYVVAFRVVAADGHPYAGTVRFTLTRPGPAAGTATATAAAPAGSAAPGATGSGEDGVPAWLITGGAVVLVVFLAGAVWFGRRATRDLD